MNDSFRFFCKGWQTQANSYMWTCLMIWWNWYRNFGIYFLMFTPATYCIENFTLLNVNVGLCSVSVPKIMEKMKNQQTFWTCVGLQQVKLYSFHNY